MTDRVENAAPEEVAGYVTLGQVGKFFSDTNGVAGVEVVLEGDGAGRIVHLNRTAVVEAARDLGVIKGKDVLEYTRDDEPALDLKRTNVLIDATRLSVLQSALVDIAKNS